MGRLLAAAALLGTPASAWAVSAGCIAINSLGGTYTVGPSGAGTDTYTDPVTQPLANGEVITYSWSGNTKGAYVFISHVQGGVQWAPDGVLSSTAVSGSGSFTISGAGPDDYFSASLQESHYSSGATNIGARNSSVTINLSCSAPTPTLGLSLSYTGTPAQGGTFTLKPTVSNTGAGATSSNITVSGVLPTGLSLVGTSGTNWNCGASSGTSVVCTFSGTIASSASNTDLSITVSVATNSSLERSVTMAAVGGGASNTPSSTANIVMVPTVTGISPSTGPSTGGTPVTITGTNFSGTSGAGGVKFGTVNASSYTVISRTQINATSPANSAGIHDVRVTNGSQTSAISADDKFTYTATPPTLGVTMTHTGNAVRAQTLTYTITPSATVANTSGTLTATWNLPFGLSYVSATGIGWTCSSTSCTSPDVINAGSSGNPISLTVSVLATVANDLDSNPGVTLSGGGASSSATASDPTTVWSQGPTASVAVGSSPIANGGQSLVTVTLTNPNLVFLGVSNTISLPANLVVGSTAGTNGCGGTLSATPGSGTVAITTVIAAGPCTYSFNVTSSVKGTYAVPSGTPVGTDATTGTGGTSASLVVNASTNANLSGLSLSTGTLVPAGVNLYTASVANSVSSLTVRPTAAHSGAVIQVNGVAVASGSFSGPIALGVGTTTISVIVVAEDETTVRVTGITVTRAASAVATLSNLTLSQGTLTPVFASGTTTYTASVANAVSALTVTPTVTDATATVQVNGTTVTSGSASGSIPLSVGANVITTIVTAQDGTTTGIYTVTVNRAIAAPVTPSFTHGSVVAYNDGSNVPYGFNLSSLVTGGAPTAYAVGSATTANGGSVSVDSTGQIIYTPPTGFRGNDSFTYTASNVSGTSTPGTVTMAVGNPSFAASLTGSGTRGTALSGVSLTISGGRSTYSCLPTPVSGALPAGTALNANCTISGTPTASGTFSFVPMVTDSSTGTGPYTAAATSVSLTITAPTLVMSPAAGALPGATFGTVYSQVLTTSGGTAPYTYALTGGGMPSSTSLTPAGVLSGTPSEAGTYTFTVTATDASSGGSGGPYTVANAYTIIVAKRAQTITFGPLGNASLSASPLTLSATASSGLAVSFDSTTTSVCTVSGTTVTLLQTGTCSITASQAGDSNWNAATNVPQSFTVTPALLAIARNAPTGTTVGASYTQTNPASGGVAPYTYSLAAGAFAPGTTLNTSTGTVSGTPTVAGTFSYIVRVTDSQGTPATADTTVTTTTIARGAQTITFGPLANASLSASPLTLSATTSSGLSVSFASTTASVCTVSGTTVTLLQTGTCSITASQAGDSNWNAATNVPQSFTVTPLTLTIATNAPTGTSVGASYTQTNPASGGVAPYTYALDAGAVPTGTTLDVATGTVSGTPSFAGTYNYRIRVADSQGTPVTATGTITTAVIARGAQTITFGGLANASLSASPLTLSATT
ncbi:beta strand repeat-containing protein, partial [Sphingomonas soli]|uniref:beta strand repeat-containing protein n=1 Tax=Sphingomonas soli TaxID=266127 RepID=UPI00157B0983